MTANRIKILIVDDDPALLAVLEAGLRMQPDYEITAVTGAGEALGLIEGRLYDLVITDYSLGDKAINGLTLLRAVRRRSETTLVIIITAFASLEITLESIHWGAYDFLTKPFQLEELQLVVRNAADRIHLEQENETLRGQIAQLIGALEEMQQQQGELMERMSTLSDDSGSGETPVPGSTALGAASLMELRRRRMREQLTAYVRQGETIRERLRRERENIETLFKKGMLSEQAYQRAIKERKQDPAS